MPTYRYVTLDVFTDTRFGGNQLAVLPDARGLTDEQMLAITREFNYSETTFVFPPEDPGHTRCVRIFTPGGEIPFAGHPTVGTAFALAALGEVSLLEGETRIILEEGVGPVPVVIRARDRKPVFAQLTAAKPPEIGPPLPDRDTLARILSLEPHDILTARLRPQIVSVGLPFAFVPIRDREALRLSRVRLDAWEEHLGGGPGAMLFLFTDDERSNNVDIHARMYAPGISIPEDPATGSACAALGGYLAMRHDAEDGTLMWTVEQGRDMGRPSIIEVEADKKDGRVTAIRVGGASVMVCEGAMRV